MPISRASSNQFSLEEDHIMRVKIKAEELRHSNIGAAIVKWYITSLKLCMSEDVWQIQGKGHTEDTKI